jgi:RNA polymerase sigma factor (sigma-70 family)
MGGVEAQLGRLFAAGTLTGLTDAQLLERFASRGDELAFEAMMARHASLVLGVCRNVLRDPNDTEDAFQATFLVLARKARSIRTGNTLGSWLCRVAYRIAVRAGAESRRRRLVEHRGTERDAETIASDPADGPGADELAVLFEELDRLPERYRIPVVLCHLEGLTTEAAAERLGCPVGTVWGRLSRARAQLRQRLVRRGIALSAGGLTGEIFCQTTRAAVPATLSETTVRAAVKFIVLDAMAAGATSARVINLTKGALRAMVQAQMRTAAFLGRGGRSDGGCRDGGRGARPTSSRRAARDDPGPAGGCQGATARPDTGTDASLPGRSHDGHSVRSTR